MNARPSISHTQKAFEHSCWAITVVGLVYVLVESAWMSERASKRGCSQAGAINLVTVVGSFLQPWKLAVLSRDYPLFRPCTYFIDPCNAQRFGEQMDAARDETVT